jgi:hypothetical protein
MDVGRLKREENNIKIIIGFCGGGDVLYYLELIL